MSNSNPELVITRLFDAPRKAVWLAWCDPAQSVKWAGPRGFTAHDVTGELRPGGKWRMAIRRDDTGEDLWQGGVYREVVELERLVFTFAWDGDDGLPENEMLITLLFEDHDGKTKFTLRQTGFRSVEQRDGHNGGWNSAFDCLEEFLR